MTQLSPPVCIESTDRPVGPLRSVLLGLLLVAAVLVVGAPGLDAPWMLGDEYIFIVNNPLVNPSASPDAAPELATRLGRIFTNVHDDLYQPLPIATFAIEWVLGNGDATIVRRNDLLLHAINALLLWWVLRRLLAGASKPYPQTTALVCDQHEAPVENRCPKGSGIASNEEPVRLTLLSWFLAAIWALHPMLVTAYASDMGRTHLLSATFSLLAIGAHERALRLGKPGWFVATIGALLLAMLSKPVVGWLVVALVLEARHNGWAGALRSWRIWLVAVVCGVFAAVTVWTGLQSGLVEQAAEGLYGDPISRSALAVWIYARNLLAPLWLCFWYLPDPDTGWAHPLVWVGLLVAVASWAHAAWSWRRPETRVVTLGWAWCWAVLLPVIGLVGARETAATDRYFYQPLMGILLVIGGMLWRVLMPTAGLQRKAGGRVVALAGAVLLVFLGGYDLPLVGQARSPLLRAERVVELNPGDPRAELALAAAQDFSRNHQLLAADRERVPAGHSQFAWFNELLVQTLTRVTQSETLPTFFTTPAQQAALHRELAFRFRTAGAYEQGLEQAREAVALEPDSFGSWRRLAQAERSLGQYEEAAGAYARCEELLPDDPQARLVHYTEYGYLLMFMLDRDQEAVARFARVLELGPPPTPAKLGLARWEIRHGEGVRGFALVREVLAEDPGNFTAGMVLAEYHLRSHHWSETAAVYDAILRDHPTHYTALRGFHEVCLQLGRYRDAALAWQEAAEREPGNRVFEAFLGWTLAIAGEPAAGEVLGQICEAYPNDPLGCLGEMVLALRRGDLEQTRGWIERAVAGEPLPETQPFERAVATLRLLGSRGELPLESVIAEGLVVRAVTPTREFPFELRERLQALPEVDIGSAWRPALSELLGVGATTQPAR